MKRKLYEKSKNVASPLQNGGKLKLRIAGATCQVADMPDSPSKWIISNPDHLLTLTFIRLWLYSFYNTHCTYLAYRINKFYFDLVALMYNHRFALLFAHFRRINGIKSSMHHIMWECFRALLHSYAQRILKLCGVFFSFGVKNKLIQIYSTEEHSNTTFSDNRLKDKWIKLTKETQICKNYAPSTYTVIYIYIFIRVNKNCTISDIQHRQPMRQTSANNILKGCNLFNQFFTNLRVTKNWRKTQIVITGLYERSIKGWLLIER